MTLRIAAVGCSYTWGSELSDSSQAWPAVVARALGTTCDNFALPAAGNQHILRTVAEQVGHYDLWLIGWTGYDRTEFRDSEGRYTVWPGRPRPAAGGRRLIATVYTADADLAALYHDYLVCVAAVQALLISQGAAWVMLDAFLNSEDPFRAAPENQALIRQIRTDRWVDWPGGNMRRWTDPLPKGPGGHTLTEGHALTARKVLAHV
jgi:hypothetical protein